MKQDERDLLREALKSAGQGNKPTVFVDALGASIGIPSKRVHFILAKWCDKGWWNYGVTARSGWFDDINGARAALYQSEQAKPTAADKGEA